MTAKLSVPLSLRSSIVSNCGLGLVAFSLTVGATDAVYGQGEETVPLTSFDVQSTHSTETALRDSGRKIGEQSISLQQVTFLQRKQLGQGSWYLGMGLQAESFSFGGRNRAAVNGLRDVAGQLSLEYFVGNTPAAALSLKPGFFFEDTVRAAAFDMPVQAVSGIPITPTLNGVIGVAGARFYKQPIPIVGLSWTIRPDLRLDAVFPEPSLIYSPSKTLEFKIGGELQSGGFRTDSGTSVEYYSYQVKTRVTYSMTKMVKVFGAIGYEVERSFDYFDRGQQQKSQGAVLVQAGAGMAF